MILKIYNPSDQNFKDFLEDVNLEEVEFETYDDGKNTGVIFEGNSKKNLRYYDRCLFYLNNKLFLTFVENNKLFKYYLTLKDLSNIRNDKLYIYTVIGKNRSKSSKNCKIIQRDGNYYYVNNKCEYFLELS